VANQVLGLLRGVPVTAPSALYLGLLTGSTSATEVTVDVWPAYARRPLGVLASAWEVFDGGIANAARVDFPSYSGSDALVLQGIALFDAATGGNVWAVAPMTSAILLEPGDPVTLEVGSYAEYTSGMVE
jgi:hypothetical protein